MFRASAANKCANGFIANYLTYLSTSLYAIVISLFLSSDIHYSPILVEHNEPYQFQDPKILQIGELQGAKVYMFIGFIIFKKENNLKMCSYTGYIYGTNLTQFDFLGP